MKWIWLGPVLVWAVICLAVVLYTVFKSFGIRDFHSDDCVLMVCLFFALLFWPLWYPIKYFFHRRELKDIKQYVEGIRNKTGSVESK